MNSQLRFVMHASDESEFVAQVLSDPGVCLIDGPRWKASSPETFRAIESISGDYCIIWSKQDRAKLRAEYIKTCDDWYCESEEATIQFLRSRTVGLVITEGRIAIGTSSAKESEAKGVERRFRALVRFVKNHYSNSIVCWANPNAPFAPAGPGRSANPSEPDPQVWVGPHALRWLQETQERCIKQFLPGGAEARLVVR